ncbi:myoD family inhibitor domain-containing protein [Denticeps clupeoides]|uniref:MyoD family inhibitor domain-containing protein n=1 Tax=Denticeps clupeoides TaxID=299321 RepID=A0AAY4ESU6_9TELE|nr:myoD family inhibitor domain-containing protein [Denticeps clupeoides]XP_028811300.1 myoD family inhibitor domain-containing protein [Denticeps clupeoides]XP_028811301.1 myoD family inhibitor domain-containing protein [Denticeps clupeoides]XP_028811302.1 myoD family inhibitor domain-containing protein [Denticeps clupeoides]XP_028811303.1 myoD family inhibitor domain-containing protein [Denticeps clupeoides]XP_028811304.1 myoD family inhibitor domain-containing protein [Denticeps clupeoides]
MSAVTVSPQEGPAGPKTDSQGETCGLLDKTTDTCNNESPGATENTRISSPEERTSEGQHHVSGERQAGDTLVRTQPQSLPLPSASAEGDAARHQNGLSTPLSNGHGGVRPGVTVKTHSAQVSEPRRHHPSPVSHKMQRKLRSSLSVSSDSSRKSKGSSAGSHKHDSSPEDCCVHCILACLFCEFLTLCNMVVAQASCGTCTSEACCCCCCADDLGDDCNCPCDMDCGIMDACCESSDCLEICMECCGICFPT